MDRFTPDSIMGLIWEENWKKKELGSNDTWEIQKEYVNFCRKFRINAPCWEPIGPYPLPRKFNL